MLIFQQNKKMKLMMKKGIIFQGKKFYWTVSLSLTLIKHIFLLRFSFWSFSSLSISLLFHTLIILACFLYKFVVNFFIAILVYSLGKSSILVISCFPSLIYHNLMRLLFLVINFKFNLNFENIHFKLFHKSVLQVY